jgi:Tetracyclin repressor-like, C-terminal domain
MLAAREVMLRHRWAPAVFESRTDMPQTLLGYYDSMLRLMRQGGLSLDLAHHAMHALGSRSIGFSQELWVSEEEDPDPGAMGAMIMQMSSHYPDLADLLKIVVHDPDSTLGGCDDQFEFEFGLDLLLDGLERLRDAEWRSSPEAA